MTMVPQGHANIGDLMTAKGLDCLVRRRLAGRRRFHRQHRLSVVAQLPGASPALQLLQEHRARTPARTAHLRDGGLGDITATNKFLADIEAGKLPPLTFYKPQGNLNMHAGYADVESGDRHIAHIVDSLRNSPQWKNMVVVITVDENGGWWDHVAPPKGDRCPLARSDAGDLAVLEEGAVDHTIYDTGSILRLATRLFDLPVLDGLKARDEAMKGRGQQPMGDLTNALTFGA